MKPVVLRIADTARRLVWRAFGPRTVGVRGLVVDEHGRVLLVQHTYGKDYWHLPGGGVKRRESIVGGLHRELREEAGIVVRGAPTMLGTYSSLADGKSDHVTVFVVERWERPSEGRSAEIERAAFFPPEDLPFDVSPATARRIAEWRTGVVTSFDW